MRPTVRERSLHDALAAHPPVSFTAPARQFHLLRRSAEKGTGQLSFWTSPRWSFSRTSPKRSASSDWLFRATPPNNLPATSPDSAGGFLSDFLTPDTSGGLQTVSSAPLQRWIPHFPLGLLDHRGQKTSMSSPPRKVPFPAPFAPCSTTGSSNNV